MIAKKTTVSIAKTPVQRALAKAKGSLLIILFVIGIVSGLVYSKYFSEKSVDMPPAGTVQQQK